MSDVYVYKKDFLKVEPNLIFEENQRKKLMHKEEDPVLTVSMKRKDLTGTL